MIDEAALTEQIQLAAAANTGAEVGDPTHSYTQGALDALRWVQGERHAPFGDAPDATQDFDDTKRVDPSAYDEPAGG